MDESVFLMRVVMAEFLVGKKQDGTIEAVKVSNGLRGYLFGIFVLPFKGLWLHFALLFPLWLFLFFIETLIKQYPASSTRLTFSILLIIIQTGVWWSPMFWGKSWLRESWLKKGTEILGEFEAADKKHACQIATSDDKQPQRAALNLTSKTVAFDSFDRIEPK